MIINNNNNTVGVVQANNFSGNLNALNLNGSTLTLQHGGMVFDAVQPSSSVIINQGTYQTYAFQPISYMVPTVPDTETQVPTDVHSEGHGAAERVTTGPPGSGNPVRVLAEPDAEFACGASTCLRIRKGSLFLQALADMTVNAALGRAYVRKGALVQVEQAAGRVSVRALSGVGDVRVIAGGRSIDLASGQELMLTDHSPTSTDLSPEDGIGRRDSRTYQIGEGLHATTCDIAIVTVISNTSRLATLHRSSSPSERKLLQQLIRAAASVDVALRGRGAFRANAKHAVPSSDSRYTQADGTVHKSFSLKVSAI